MKRVKNIIANTLEIDDVESITMETSIMNDLDADSLDAVEVMMALEDEFEIEIPDEDAETFKNIGDIVRYIEEKLNNILWWEAIKLKRVVITGLGAVTPIGIGKEEYWNSLIRR